jgi:hypothetical protein
MKMSEKLNSSDVEYAVAKFFNPRINLIVPNVYWGLGFSYELDLLVVNRPSMHCCEVEIKVVKSDIKAEEKKSHHHESKRIRRFFYAVPWYLADCEYLPKDCGLISVDENLKCTVLRPPRINKTARPLDTMEYVKLLELGCMRIWTLKETRAMHRREREFRLRQETKNDT